MEVNVNVDISDEEKQAYIDRAVKSHPDREIDRIDIEIDGDYVNLTYHFSDTPVPFKRIRRITGYLVGDLSAWNDAKRKEEEDRVKHSF